MRNSLVAILAMQLFAILAFAAPTAPTAGVNQDAVASQSDVNCAQTQDPLENPARITKSSNLYPDLCIKTTQYRFGKLESDTQDMIVVDNFYHNNRFWRAEIPKAAAAWQKAYFQIVRFPVIEGVEAAHTQLRFKLTDNYTIQLTAQDTGEKTQINSFLFSVEAAMPKADASGKKVSYNFAAGAIDNYPIVGRLVSAQQRILEGNEAAEQYELNISSTEIVKLARATILRSAGLKLNRFYNTLRPNCTTELFDLIDANISPRKDQYGRPIQVQKFYTVLWTDPIAGPSLKGLTERKLLGKRAVDMQVEYSAATGPLPPPPPPAAPSLGVIRPLKNHPFALVIITPDSKGAEQVSALVMKEVEKTLSLSLPKLSQAAVSPSILGRGAALAAGGVFREVQYELRALLKRLNPQLPNEPTMMTAILVPWDADAKQASLVNNGVAANLPFNYAKYSKVTLQQLRELLTKARNNMLLLQQAEEKRVGKVPVHLLGVEIRLMLQKNKSRTYLQTAMGVIPQTRPFQTYSDQVNITQLVFPAPLKSWFNPRDPNKYIPRSAMIMSNEQAYYEYPNPVVQIEFGPLDKMEPNYRSPNFGLMKPKRIGFELFCGERAELVPELRGQIKKLTGIQAIDNLLTGQKLALDIYGLKIVYAEDYCYSLSSKDKDKYKFCAKADLSQSGVMAWDMQTRAKVYLNGWRAVSCLQASQLDDQMTNEANASLDAQLSGLIKENQKTALDLLLTGQTQMIQNGLIHK